MTLFKTVAQRLLSSIISGLLGRLLRLVLGTLFALTPQLGVHQRLAQDACYVASALLLADGTSLQTLGWCGDGQHVVADVLSDGLALLGRGIALLDALAGVLAGEDDQLALVQLQTLNVLLESLLVAVLATVINGDSDTGRRRGGDTGSLSDKHKVTTHLSRRLNTSMRSKNKRIARCSAAQRRICQRNIPAARPG